MALLAAAPARRSRTTRSPPSTTIRSRLKITGTLTKVDWMNPHIWYYVDVKNADGSVTSWAISGGAPGQLMRRGITKDLLVVGSTVNVEGFRAKDGSNNGFGQRVTYQDGRNVFTATDPAGRAPQR